jgi:hypothetical protein
MGRTIQLHQLHVSACTGHLLLDLAAARDAGVVVPLADHHDDLRTAQPWLLRVGLAARVDCDVQRKHRRAGRQRPGSPLIRGKQGRGAPLGESHHSNALGVDAGMGLEQVENGKGIRHERKDGHRYGTQHLGDADATAPMRVHHHRRNAALGKVLRVVPVGSLASVARVGPADAVDDHHGRDSARRAARHEKNRRNVDAVCAGQHVRTLIDSRPPRLVLDRGELELAGLEVGHR